MNIHPIPNAPTGHIDLKSCQDSDSSIHLAHKILAEIMNYRRSVDSQKSCHDSYCHQCMAPHLDKVISAISKNMPILFVLPAFPGKSPSPEKVLGHLPDHAEVLSLKFLDGLCKKIESIYPPGMNITLCSDGRVFSDIVGMKESHVTNYQNEMRALIYKHSISNISIFKLDDYYQGLNFIQMRDELMKGYGQSLDFLRQKIRNGDKPYANPEEQEANRMYCGISRFLFEDSKHAHTQSSNNALQKRSRLRAFEVIRRSNAWSKLIADLFPSAVRLSIHPQTCGAEKLGIRLIANESWMTPWHSVAVEGEHGFQLMKRVDAENIGARLLYCANGRPSHYQLMPS